MNASGLPSFGGWGGGMTWSQNSRPIWCPGMTPPAHLDGSLAGDYGFDPLGLGADPEALKWYASSCLHRTPAQMLSTLLKS